MKSDSKSCQWQGDEWLKQKAVSCTGVTYCSVIYTGVHQWYKKRIQQWKIVLSNHVGMYQCISNLLTHSSDTNFSSFYVIPTLVTFVSITSMAAKFCYRLLFILTKNMERQFHTIVIKSTSIECIPYHALELGYIGKLGDTFCFVLCSDEKDVQKKNPKKAPPNPPPKKKKHSNQYLIQTNKYLNWTDCKVQCSNIFLTGCNNLLLYSKGSLIIK